MLLLLVLFCSTAGSHFLKKRYSLRLAAGFPLFALSLFPISFISGLCVKNGTAESVFRAFISFGPAPAREPPLAAAVLFTPAIAAISSLILGRFSSARLETAAARRHTRISIILIIVPSIIFFAYIWARCQYPLEQPEAVFYTLAMPLTGMDSALPREIILQVALPVIASTAAFGWLLRLAACHSFTDRKSGRIHAGGGAAFLISAFISLFFLAYTALSLPLSSYIQAVRILKARPETEAESPMESRAPGSTAMAGTETPGSAGLSSPSGPESAQNADQPAGGTASAAASSTKAEAAARAEEARAAALRARDQRALGDAFYRAHYVDPSGVQLEFPAEKKNLIIIMMESMESSFSDKDNGGFFDENYIPNLSAIAKDNINFSATGGLGGGMKLYGTNWTIAAFLSKFNGIPFALSGSLNPAGLKHFLPGSTGLTDILAAHGYRQRFIFGSDEAFASRGTFFRDHGNVELHDYNYYKKNGMIPDDYHVYWGIEDQRLYPLAEAELDELSKSDTPFMFGLLTVDTHTPGGYICSLCPDNGSKTEEGRFTDVVLCADRQVSDFLEWAEKQSWYDNTVIVIMGDHQFMNRRVFPASATVSTRYWIDIIINSAIPLPAPGADKHRRFSSFDMFPTILESIGAAVPGHALGFGRSLFSSEPTLIEELGGIDEVNAGLEHPSSVYDSWIKPR